MIRLFTKLALSTGVILGVYFLEINKGNPTLVNYEEKEILPKIEKISSIEDIEIFEKINQCSFVFTRHWKNKDSYGAREYLKQIWKRDDVKNWEKNIIKAATSKLAKCKTEKIVPLIWKGNKQEFIEYKMSDSKKK